MVAACIWISIASSEMCAFWLSPLHQRFWMSFVHCTVFNILSFHFHLKISNFPWFLPYFHCFSPFFRIFRFKVVCSNDNLFLLAHYGLFSSFLFLFGSLFGSKRHFFPPKSKTENSACVVHSMFIHRQSQYLFVNLIFPCIPYNIIHSFGSPILLLNLNHNAVHCCCCDIVIVFLDNFQKKNISSENFIYSEYDFVLFR